MGIPGLHSFIERRTRTGTRIIWPYDDQVNIKDTKYLIVDALAFAHNLYLGCLDWSCGGQYQEFGHLIKTRVQQFKRAGFSLYFVFDGCINPAKFEVAFGRCQEKCGLLPKVFGEITTKSKSRGKPQRPFMPQLFKEVFLETLRSMGDVPYVVAEGEADLLVAELANKWHTYALSQDADYHVFNLQIGYIPLQSIVYEKDGIHVTVYKATELADYFGMDVELLPLLASLSGNDYVSSEQHTSLIRALSCSTKRNVPSGFHQRIEMVAEYLKQFEHFPEALSSIETINIKQSFWKDSETMTSTLVSSLAQYHMNVPSCHTIHTILPPDVVSLFTNGKFPAKLVSLLCFSEYWCIPSIEQPNEKTAYIATRDIRQYTYGLLLSEPNSPKVVKEYLRRGPQYTVELISPLYKDSHHDYLQVRQMADNDKCQLLNSILKINTICVDKLPSSLRLCVISAYYLFKCQIKTPNNMLAFIAMWLLPLPKELLHLSKSEVSAKDQGKLHSPRFRKFIDLPLKPQIVQQQNLYQNILYQIHLLTRLIDYQTWPLDPEVIYNGVAFHWYSSQVVAFHYNWKNFMDAQKCILGTGFGSRMRLFGEETNDECVYALFERTMNTFAELNSA